MSFELFIARRYLRARRKQAFVSVITFISILGIAIGVMALVIALGLITGFQRDVQDKILGATSHLVVSDLGSGGIPGYRDLRSRIQSLPGVKVVSPVVYDIVLISGPLRSHGATLKGIDFDLDRPHYKWLRDLEQGELPAPAGRDGLVLGKDLAYSLGVGPGDTVSVLTTSSLRLSPLGPVPRLREFQVTGVFAAGLYEFDSTTALTPLPAAQRLFRLDDRVTHLQIMVEDIFQAGRLADSLRGILPPTLYVTTWMELNRTLFSALKLEKTILFLTITLIVFVAALNIIASLILMVMEKTRDIGILMAIGAPAASIQKIFFLQGAMIGVLGTTAGVALGLIASWLANTFELIKVPVDIYQISFVPFRIQLVDLLLIVAVSLAISLLSTLFPSRRAAKVDPVVALKYE